MFAIEAKFSATEFSKGRARFLGLEVVPISEQSKAFQELKRNKGIAVFSSQELANQVMRTINPEKHTLSYRVRSRIFVAVESIGSV